ncbi:T9SS type A sorting domain-containing protein [Aequorivita capsosiphonis]|uniref:T9SS type A sorting domain-containing protein n=1 Tax=Aequorivita capsosiphonis TaxID=487317 RepID=UPI000426D8D3|nr:T9SS type A sorting domain-containing protein [Aequorivita capsosiphonis]
MKKRYNISVQKVISVIFFFVLSLNAFNFYAQITNIPDPIFEQALIDLGIDSDGVVNGQVLTSDIEAIISLDVSERFVHDLTGIEGFASLEDLNVSYNTITSSHLIENNNLKKLVIDNSLELVVIDVTSNYLLEYLYCSLSLLSDLDVSNNLLLKELSLGASLPSDTNIIEILELSNNAALEKLHLLNMASLTAINLQSGNNQILVDVLIHCSLDFGEPCEPIPCMEVDDLAAAQTNQLPYSAWDVVVNYSEDCLLGIATQQEKVFSIFPNPVQSELTITSKQETGNLAIKIVNLEGKVLSTPYLDFGKKGFINVSNLSSGLYFLNIETENGKVETNKFIKE